MPLATTAPSALNTVKLEYGDKTLTLPVIEGSEGELGVDIQQLRAKTGLIALDPGFGYKALGIPVNMFTVMFAIGRLPGWIAQWLEMRDDPETRIARPRQIYTGSTRRAYVRVEDRG